MAGNTSPQVQAFWEDFLDDAEATAEEYREAGWDVLLLHPGAVTPLPAGTGEARDERVGLDVLLPGDEFEAVEDLADADFDEFDAYRAERGEAVFLVVVMKAPGAGQAVVLPVYYVLSEAAETVSLVRERGEMRTFLRPLSNDRHVMFSQSDPELLLPDQSGNGTGGDGVPVGDDVENEPDPGEPNDPTDASDESDVDGTESTDGTEDGA